MAKAQVAPVSSEREDPFAVIKTHALLLFLVEDELNQKVREAPQAGLQKPDGEQHDV